jgi:hypothetical protein
MYIVCQYQLCQHESLHYHQLNFVHDYNHRKQQYKDQLYCNKHCYEFWHWMSHSIEPKIFSKEIISINKIYFNLEASSWSSLWTKCIMTIIMINNRISNTTFIIHTTKINTFTCCNTLILQIDLKYRSYLAYT